MRTLEVGPASELFSSIFVFGNFLSTNSLVFLHIRSLSAFLRCILENPLGLARVLTVHLIGTSPTCDNSPRIRMSSPSPISFILPAPHSILSHEKLLSRPHHPQYPSQGACWPSRCQDCTGRTARQPPRLSTASFAPAHSTHSSPPTGQLLSLCTPPPAPRRGKSIPIHLNPSRLR